MNLKSCLVSTVSAAAVAWGIVGAPALGLDLGKAGDAHEAMLRMMADADGKPVFKDWDVTIFAVLPGEKPKPILRMQGFNAGRLVARADGGHDLVTREVSFYQDLKTGEIIESWHNPLNGKDVCVLHVANDPVNNSFARPSGAGVGVPFNIRGDITSLRLDIPLAYPNPLTPKEYSEESTGATYLASEHFIYFADTPELTSDTLRSVPTHYSWFRTGPWLPWMKMGAAPGYLIYSGQGRKYATFEELPQKIKAYTREHYPTYVTAPERFQQPNETSWTVYAKRKKAGALPTDCK